MFETIQTSTCPKAPLQFLGSRLMAGVLGATIFFSLAPAVWADSYNNSDISDIAAALSTSQTVPHEAQDLASDFVDRALPKLLTNDVRVAKRLGFGDIRGSTAVLDQALPLIIMYQKDVLQFENGNNSDPIELINNANNWIKDHAVKLAPKRIIFTLKVNDGASESGPHSWSAVTLEMSPSGSWRVLQVGAPKLARAMKLYEAPRTNYFLLWIPDLNRHYLGQIGPMGPDATHPPIILTVLFNDPLAQRSAGEQFDITSGTFIERLKKLYQDLQLEKILQGQSNRE
jgi:hypothetical protein